MMTVRELMDRLACCDADATVELYGGEGEYGCYASLYVGRRCVMNWSEDEEDEEE